MIFKTRMPTKLYIAKNNQQLFLKALRVKAKKTAYFQRKWDPCTRNIKGKINN